MSETIGEGTMSSEKSQTEMQSPNEKIHGEPPAGSPMPGVESPESEEVKREVNPNTE